MIAGLLFMAGMRRSEVSALRWADVVDSTDGAGFLVTVRRNKDSDRYRFANFATAQPLFRCLARLGRGKVIPVTVLRRTRKVKSTTCGS